jgi:hypothetical protein
MNGGGGGSPWPLSMPCSAGGGPVFQRIIDDFKASASSAMRLSSLAAIAGIALFIALSFLCAAAFVAVMDVYGLVYACLAGAAIFLLAALIVIAVYAVQKRRAEARSAARAKSAAHALLADPVLLATGLQIVRAVGVKRLLPILAVGGLALGLLVGRNQAGGQAPAE